MRAVTAVRAELRRIGADAASSALGVVALGLAARLDAGPSDRDAVTLARELRMTLRELRELAGGDVVSETERFLERIANPSLHGPGN